MQLRQLADVPAQDVGDGIVDVAPLHAELAQVELAAQGAEHLFPAGVILARALRRAAQHH